MKFIPLIGGAVAGFLLAWVLWRPKAAGATAEQIAALGSNPYNTVNTNAPITIPNPPPPSGTPVSIYESPYYDMVKNAAYNIASSTGAMGARVAANAPASAFNAIGDATSRQQLVASFSGIGNPLDNAVFPFPSEYIDQTLKEDIEKILLALDTLASMSTRLVWDSWISQNKQKLTLRYYPLDLSETVTAFKVNGRLPILRAFFVNLQAAHQRLNEEIFKRAVAQLKTRGYRFVEYP